MLGLVAATDRRRVPLRDIDWENNRINVPSPTTERLAGGAYRTIPPFKELQLILEEAFDLAELGSYYVIGRYRGDNQNLRTEHPLHVVCSWIGNSAIIAAKHLLAGDRQSIRQNDGAFG